MRIWALADLHLSFGVPNKEMSLFGPAWENHIDQVETHWRALIQPTDLVLIAGDISWAMRLEEAMPDLEWIDSLPGTKLLLRGNHDYWWSSLKQITAVLPPSLHLLQNNCFVWKEVAVGGARLWDTPEYTFGPFIEYRENPNESSKKSELVQRDLSEKIFQRELQRLEMSLSQFPPDAKVRIAMTHYPPIGADLAPSQASAILEKYKVQLCVFGHLHNIKTGACLFGEKNGIRYILTACDYTRFQPILVL